MTLYEIKDEYLAALEHIEVNEDGEILNIEEIENAEGEFNDKLEAIGCYIKSEMALGESLKAEAKKLTERAQAHLNKVERLKAYVTMNMGAVGIDSFETAKVRFSFRRSASVNITNEESIPDEYIEHVTSTKIDKMALKKALKDGLIVEGAELVESANLQIK